MKRLYYPGSFNPVGNHHFIVAQMAMEWGGYDWVSFIPCYHAPHKTNLIPYNHRREMLRIGSSFHGSRFEISDIEEELYRQTGRKSYTIETVRALKRMRPSENVHLLIGSDSLANLHSWYDVSFLLQEGKLVVAPRTHEPSGCPTNSIIHAPIPIMDVSSTLIRNRIEQGKSIHYLVPRGVEEYILQNKLYLPPPVLVGERDQWNSGPLCRCNVCKRETRVPFMDGSDCNGPTPEEKPCYGIFMRVRNHGD